MLFAVTAVGSVMLFVPSVAPASAHIAVRGFWAVAFLATLGGIVGTIAARSGAKRARIVGAVLAVGVPLVTCMLHRDGELSAVDGVCPLWLSHDPVAARGVLDPGLGAWACAAAVSLAVMFYAVRARPANA
jgi:hypothetical protein